MAVLLNRSRQDYALPDIKCGWELGKIKLHFPLGWLDQAPLTRADLLHEATNLKTARIKLEIQ
ncbi:MAG UNVERIFIED_CONTAM: hypothetical protein LVT10_17685 [Anaerolineae bacterium]